MINIINYENKEYRLSTEKVNDKVYETIVSLIENGEIIEDAIYSFRTVGNDDTYNERVVIEYLNSKI